MLCYNELAKAKNRKTIKIILKKEKTKMAINEKELNEVAGGYGPWQQYAKGSYVNYGQYIVYTVVGGDVMSGIAIRFGVTEQQICQWNNIQNKDLIYVNQKLTIYPTILR